MNNESKQLLDELIERYPKLISVKDPIVEAFKILCYCYDNGNKVLCCGNGGSASDSEHIVGELMKSFKFKRNIDENLKEKLLQDDEFGEVLARDLEGALPAISLCGHPALTSAYLNDSNPLLTFAQQINGLGVKNDVLIAISTSGNSKNCIYAAITAKAKNMKVVSLTGERGGKLKCISDCCINVPENETYKIQEYHLPIYHCLCAMLEVNYFVK